MARHFSAKAFAAWMRTNGISNKRAAVLLGCSPVSIYNWKRSGAPHYIGLACAALEAGLGSAATRDDVLSSDLLIESTLIPPTDITLYERSPGDMASVSTTSVSRSKLPSESMAK